MLVSLTSSNTKGPAQEDAMCRTGCKTKDHVSWGDCLRAANLTVTPVESGAKSVDFELQSYHDARMQGVQPASTRLESTKVAMAISEKRGTAFDAGKESIVSV